MIITIIIVLIKTKNINLIKTCLGKNLQTFLKKTIYENQKVSIDEMNFLNSQSILKNALEIKNV